LYIPFYHSYAKTALLNTSTISYRQASLKPSHTFKSRLAVRFCLPVNLITRTGI